MRRIDVKQLDYELTAVVGMMLVGQLLAGLSPQWAQLDQALRVRAGVASSDILRNYLGLLVQGKSYFDAIGGHRGEAFFKSALGIALPPSSPTLRQRMDPHTSMMFEHVPDIAPEGWTTSLGGQACDAGQIIALYADHGTHEQFHAEFKTDLDLQRLPSGKFDTNYLVCALAALAMNVLRLMGQRGLLGPDAPVRHAAKRRRIKTVMQELVYKAGRLIASGRRLILGLGGSDRGAAVFIRLHAQFAPTA